MLPTGRRIYRRPEATGGTETSKYPEEEKSTEIPGVAASETGPAQTGARARCGRFAAVLLGGATEGRIPRPLLQTSHHRGTAWEVLPEKVIAPYPKGRWQRVYPE